jgi:hypothetical protein
MLREIAGLLTGDRFRGLIDEQPELVERLGEPGSLIDVAVEVLDLEPYQREYLEAFPGVLQEAVRASIVEAAAEGKSINMQYSPGYDFDVRVWDYGDDIGIHVSGPYPPNFPRDGFERKGP